MDSQRLKQTAILVGLLGVAAMFHACSGPRPLDQAIRASDEQVYLGALSNGETPRTAFLRAKAAEIGKPFEQVEAADLALSVHENPFNARRDPVAVSRGAVIYKYNCMRCHGVNADGHGPDMPQSTDEMDFRKFSTRFAVTIHGGAPSKWFRIINEGVTSAKGVDTLGNPLIMQPFSDTLAREQLWLVVTYLQSLEADK